MGGRFGKSLKSTKFIDYSDFIRRMNMADTRTLNATRTAMKQNRDHHENQGKELAPIDKGDLTGGIQGNPQLIETRDSITAEVHAGIDSLSAAYALYQHEEPGLEPGPKTKGRPGTEVGPAGRKYLERPLLFHMRRYTKNIVSHVKRALR
jgi:hypothetical protein